MSIIKSNMTAPPPSSGGLSDIGEMNSLRFDGSSYLSRRLTNTGNQKIWTLSCWIKRAKLSSSQHIFSFGLVGGGNNGVATIAFDSTDSFYAYFDSSGSNPYGAVSTTNLMRDTSSFYHIVWQVDASTSSADYWVNSQKVQNPGVQPPDYTYGNQTGWDMMIGTQAWGPTSPHLSGYMANIQFIDGAALEPTAFGEMISDIWVPKEYTGTYGTNGFYLDFDQSNMDWTNGKVLDASGNGNDWDIN